MLKLLLQNFVVRTNFWPFAPLCRACYAFILKWIVQNLQKEQDIIAIYLVSGMASGDYIPGLSDIDLFIIVKDVEGAKLRVGNRYTQISRMVPLLKNDEQAIVNLADIKRSFVQSGFYFKYKFFTECKKQGKLLYGVDILRDFKELDAAQRNEFIIGQMAFNWSLFLKNFLLKNNITDALILNYFCYKLASDTCKALISARDGKEIFNRRAVLKYALPSFYGERKAHIERITKLAQQKFLGVSGRLLEDTYNFCIETIKETVSFMPGIPLSDEDKQGHQDVYCDLASLDFILSDANRDAIDLFVDRVKSKYTDYISSILVSPVDLLHMEEQNIGIFLVPQKHLPLKVIKELVAILGSQKCPQNLYLYVVIADIAISLNGFEPTHIESAFFPLRWMSATFLYLSTAHAVRFGQPLNYSASKKLVRDYFCEDIRGAIEQDKMDIRRLINDQHILRKENIEFQHLFWYAFRLRSIEGFVNAGKVYLPLSSKQVCQSYDNDRTPDLPWLERFRKEYIKDLNGVPSDSENYFSQALEVLKEHGFE